MLVSCDGGSHYIIIIIIGIIILQAESLQEQVNKLKADNCCVAENIGITVKAKGALNLEAPIINIKASSEMKV